MVGVILSIYGPCSAQLLSSAVNNIKLLSLPFPVGSCLICVHSVYNIGYQSTLADERVDNNCREWRESG